jgi:hypothetical protein
VGVELRAGPSPATTGAPASPIVSSRAVTSFRSPERRWKTTVPSTTATVAAEAVEVAPAAISAPVAAATATARHAGGFHE